MEIAKVSFCILILCAGLCSSQTVFNWFAPKSENAKEKSVVSSTSSPSSLSQTKPSSLYYYGTPDPEDSLPTKKTAPSSPDLTAFARITNGRKRVVTKTKVVNPDANSLVFGQRISSSVSKTRTATTIRSIATRQTGNNPGDNDLNTTPATIIAPEFDDDFVLQEPPVFTPGASDKSLANLPNSGKSSSEVDEEENLIINSGDKASSSVPQALSLPSRGFQSSTETKQSFSQQSATATPQRVHPQPSFTKVTETQPKRPTTFRAPTIQTTRQPITSSSPKASTFRVPATKTTRQPITSSSPKATFRVPAIQTTRQPINFSSIKTQTVISKFSEVTEAPVLPPRVRIEYERLKTDSTGELEGSQKLYPKITSQFSSVQTESKQQTTYVLPKAQATKQSEIYGLPKSPTVQPKSTYGIANPTYKPSKVSVETEKIPSDSKSYSSSDKFSAYPKTVYQYFATDSNPTTPAATATQRTYTGRKVATTQSPATTQSRYKTNSGSATSSSGTAADSGKSGSYPKTVYQYFQSNDKPTTEETPATPQSRYNANSASSSSSSGTAKDSGKSIPYPKTVYQYFQSDDSPATPATAQETYKKVATTQSPATTQSKYKNVQASYTTASRDAPTNSDYGNSKSSGRVASSSGNSADSGKSNSYQNQKQIYQYFQNDDTPATPSAPENIYPVKKVATTQVPITILSKSVSETVQTQSRYKNTGPTRPSSYSSAGTASRGKPTKVAYGTPKPSSYGNSKSNENTATDVYENSSPVYKAPQTPTARGRVQPSYGVSEQSYGSSVKSGTSRNSVKVSGNSSPSYGNVGGATSAPAYGNSENAVENSGTSSETASDNSAPSYGDAVPAATGKPVAGSYGSSVKQSDEYSASESDGKSVQQSNADTANSEEESYVNVSPSSNTNSAPSSSYGNSDSGSEDDSDDTDEESYGGKPKPDSAKPTPGTNTKQSSTSQPSYIKQNVPYQAIQPRTTQKSKVSEQVVSYGGQQKSQESQSQIISKPGNTESIPQEITTVTLYQLPSGEFAQKQTKYNSVAVITSSTTTNPQGIPTFPQTSRDNSDYGTIEQRINQIIPYGPPAPLTSQGQSIQNGYNQPSVQQGPQQVYSQAVQPTQVYKDNSQYTQKQSQQGYPQPQHFQIPIQQPRTPKLSQPQPTYQPQQRQQPYPLTPQPTYQQPAQPQPTYQQPAQPQPTYQQPAQPQPTYQQPAQPQQSYQQPAQPQQSYQQPAQPRPTYQQPAQPQPTYQQPAQPQQSYQQPAQPQQSYQQPAQPRPTYQQPAQPQPTYQQPPQPRPNYQRPQQPQPSYQRPQISQPTYQQPAQPQPTYQQPAQPQPTYQPVQPQKTYQQPAISQPPQAAYQQPSQPTQAAYQQPSQTTQAAYQQPSQPQPTYQQPSYQQPSQPPQGLYQQSSQPQPTYQQPFQPPPTSPQSFFKPSQPIPQQDKPIYQQQPPFNKPAQTQAPLRVGASRSANNAISADSFDIVPAKLVFEEWSTFDQTVAKVDPPKYSYNGVSR